MLAICTLPGLWKAISSLLPFAFTEHASEDKQSTSASVPSTGIPFASNFEYRPTRSWNGRTGEFSLSSTFDPATTWVMGTSFAPVTVFCCQVP